MGGHFRCIAALGVLMGVLALACSWAVPAEFAKAAERPPVELAGQPHATAGGFDVPVACPASSGEGCHGTIEGTVFVHIAHSGTSSLARVAITWQVTVGVTPFSLTAAQTRLISVDLSREGHQLLARPAPLVVLLSVRVDGGSGQTPETQHVGYITILKLDTKRVASAIRSVVLNQAHLHSNVSCPATIIQVEGNTFTCWASGTISHVKTSNTTGRPL